MVPQVGLGQNEDGVVHAAACKAPICMKWLLRTRSLPVSCFHKRDSLLRPWRL